MNFFSNKDIKHVYHASWDVIKISIYRHLLWLSVENRYGALSISPTFIKFLSPSSCLYMFIFVLTADVNKQIGHAKYQKDIKLTNNKIIYVLFRIFKNHGSPLSYLLPILKLYIYFRILEWIARNSLNIQNSNKARHVFELRFSAFCCMWKFQKNPFNLNRQEHNITHSKIGTLSVHVFAHGDCTVAKGFNQ
jgi:hypothetical protein